jgi:pimeloyl-ACP methyl ester carboxylesterase
MTRPFQRGRFDELPARPRRPHRYFDSPAREVVVDSAHFGKVRIHYRELGAGPPLLLVHGLMTTSYSWRYVMDDLARDHRVIVPDLPGAGRSDKPDVAYGSAALARFVLELQAALGLRGCLAVGNSMGGFVCMRAALADAGAFARLVNLHSPGAPGGRYRALHLALSLPGARSLLSWWIRRTPLSWAHKNVHYYDESLKSLEEASEYGDPLASREGASAFIHYLHDTFAPADLAAFVGELRTRRDAGQAFPMPLLLLYARQDPLVLPAIGEQLARLVPDARLEWLEKTSHFAHVDTPDAVLASVRAFLGEAAATPGDRAGRPSPRGTSAA